MNPVTRNMRTEERFALKKANVSWNTCVAEKFLPGWLNGENLNVNEVCKEELETMKEQDVQNYPELPFQFQKAD